MNKTLEKEEVVINAKKPLKTLYKGVKLPVFKTLLGSLLYMIGTLAVATQADNLSKIQIGSFSDLSPVFTYALMCMIGYVFFYISVVADLAFVDLAGNVRKKIWKKVMNLPLSYYDREGANKVISRVTSDPEYSYMPFKLFQLFFTLVLFLLLVLVGDAAITELALILMGGFIVTMVIMFASAKFSEKGAAYVAGKLADFTAFLAERFNRIRFIKAMNSEEKEADLAVAYITERYEAEKYNAIAATVVQFGQMFLTLVLQMSAFLFGGLLISQGKVDSTTRLVAFYGYGSNLVLVFQFFA
ncbi:MAG: ABC transporter ATP-binding protein, partial [Erysipelotrichaceae bacterium]|nr:ABC transporter ATP-binding protein [Erysipelotrichaceae bacterium]